jgi:hypothetical protein
VLLGDSDRERLFELLSRHTAAGRLTVDELERRVGLVTEARTCEEARAVLSDLQPLPSTSNLTPGSHRGRRGHGETTQPAADWTPTSERFRDPRSAQVMRVWIDTGGGRHYVPDA